MDTRSVLLITSRVKPGGRFLVSVKKLLSTKKNEIKRLLNDTQHYSSKITRYIAKEFVGRWTKYNAYTKNVFTVAAMIYKVMKK